MAEAITVYAPDVWAQESLMVLENELVMARLVHRDFENVIAQYGDVINTRKPDKLTVKSWAGQAGSSGLADDEIEVQRPTATNVPVTLNQHKYTSFMEEDRPAAVSLKNLREEFIFPSLSPIAEEVDLDIIKEFLSISPWSGVDYLNREIASIDTIGSAAAAEDVIALRKALNTTKCPEVGRVLVVGSDHEADLLADSLFIAANESGSTEALVNARLGRKLGFDIYHTQQMPNNATSTTNGQSIAFHKNALAFVVRPLRAIPGGLGAVSAVASHGGMSVRVTTSYNNRGMGIDVKFDLLYGIRLLDRDLCRLLIG